MVMMSSLMMRVVLVRDVMRGVMMIRGVVLVRRVMRLVMMRSVMRLLSVFT